MTSPFLVTSCYAQHSKINTRFNKRIIALLVSTAITAPTLGGELPSGATVAAGNVSIGGNDNAMTVTQQSNTAIVNWNSFSVGQGQSVNFIQPSSSSAILNRVTGSTRSSSAGAVTGNGQVYLINSSGIAITSSGSVKVGGGFVASTLDIKDEDFLKGNHQVTGNGNAAEVSNAGIISVGRGGYAALMGVSVKNDLLINVPVGKVGLGLPRKPRSISLAMVSSKLPYRVHPV